MKLIWNACNNNKCNYMKSLDWTARSVSQNSIAGSHAFYQ